MKIMENNIYSKKQTIKNYQNITEIIIIDKELKSLNKLKLDILNSVPLTGLLKDDNFEIILHGKVKEMIDNINKLIEHRIETLKYYYDEN